MSDNQPDDSTSTNSSETNDGRRRFLAGSAGTLGALALGSAFGAQSVLASGDAMTETETASKDMFEDDIAILNYALTLEYLEATFYSRALDNIDEGDLMSGDLDDLPESAQDRIYDDLSTIMDHEQTHVDYLTQTISDLDGEAIDKPTFDFGDAVTDTETFLATAAVLEDTGVAAYAGAAPNVEQASLIPPLLSVHSVEARHASFVRELSGEVGFPNAFDDPMQKNAVLEAAGQFIAE